MKNKFEIQDGDNIIIPQISTFPGGEVKVLVPTQPLNDVRITAYLFNSTDVMTLVMLTDALRNMGCKDIRLTMPYIPYARQDRVCNVGEAFSIRVFAQLINSMNFASVVVYDAHSKVSTNLIDRCINIHQSNLIFAHHALFNWVNNCGCFSDNIYVVAPDKGSIEKAKRVSTILKAKGVIFAEKERDLATGKIIRTVVKDLPQDIADARLLIVDDICDGGRTFIELGRVLRPYCKEMSLYVTHGIFSQGKDVLEPFFDNVWCTVNFKDYQ